MKSIPELLMSPLALKPDDALALLERYRVEGPVRAPRLDSGFSPTMNVNYDVVRGAAIIPVNGVLVHEDPFWWDEISYGQLAAKMAAALSDDEVRGVALMMNSPGGVVSGCFDFCDAMFEMRGGKPIWAIVDEAAYSAAYAIASSADRIIVPRTGGVGSIGVITMHIDITQMLEKYGVKVTTIQFGERKSDSYPTTPLSDEARERIQSDVNQLGEMFVGLVSRNRGIDASTVRETEAGCFLGEDGVRAGLADAVMPVQQALAEFIDHIS